MRDEWSTHHWSQRRLALSVPLRGRRRGSGVAQFLVVRRRMRRVIKVSTLFTAMFALATLTACVRQSAREVQFRYGRLAVAPLESTVAVLDRETTRGWHTVERSNVHFRIFDLFDTTVRRSDTVWVQDGLVFDWNQYKAIALAGGRSLILHERFQPQSRLGNPWSEFRVSANDGELPEASVADSITFSVQFTHLLYLFDPPAMLWADYDKHGDLVRIAAANQSGSTYFHVSLAKKWGESYAFATYDFPPRFDAERGAPPISASVTNGLSAITSSRFPSGSLVGCFVLNRSPRLDIMELRSFGSVGQPLGRRLLHYRTRPYDKEIAEVCWNTTPLNKSLQ